MAAGGPSPGTERQGAIYKAGLLKQKPALPVSLEALEEAARHKLHQGAFDYVAGGAGGESTVRANRQAFERWRLVPRLLRNVSQRDLSLELLGQRLRYPILLAPIGVQGIIHKEGELASARAASGLGIPFILSTAASRTIEETAQAMGDGPRWFQLYFPKDRDLAASFILRAERAGYQALVFTLDTYMLAWRERDIQNAYLPFLHADGVANYFSDPVFCSRLKLSPSLDPIHGVQHFLEVFSDPGLTWEEAIPFIRQRSRLPLVLKGILHPEDARKAVAAGVDAIIVSNHGGRQLDGARAALDALPEVAAAVDGRIPILFDSGIRRGSDILKALALGAKAVLVGRPYCYGLALNGEEGVKEVLLNLIADLDLSLGLLGCSSLVQVDRQFLSP